jgi:hypothetical protein
MGKKAKLKKIRKLASQMPEIQVRQVKGERISGAELYKSGVEKVEGKTVDIDATYRKKTLVQAPLNHNRKMKKLYNQYGAKGVGMYVNAVNRYIATQKQKVEATA